MNIIFTFIMRKVTTQTEKQSTNADEMTVKKLLRMTDPEKSGGKNLETIIKSFEPCHEKTNILVSDQVRHKPGCTATKDG